MKRFIRRAASVELRAGMRLKSAVSETQVLVIKAPASGHGDLKCGGQPLLRMSDPPLAVNVNAQLTNELAESIVLGKRYADKASSVIVLCTRAGDGALTFNEEALAILAPKPLPSSD
jgi:hypothetical protein